MHERHALPSSFRDPSGFVFRGEDGTLYRQINKCFELEFDRFVGSGLCTELQDAGLLVRHEEVDLALRSTDDAARVLRPEIIPFISYPFEWPFSLLKAAALATLEIQDRALAKDMSLRDCSAYNIQFCGTQPIFIDTLSFETYREGAPWIAYGQFCRHFLAPLALMAKCDARLRLLLRDFLDGVPLDLTASMLPWSALFNPGLFIHLRMQASVISREMRREQNSASPADTAAKGKQLSRYALRGLIDGLRRAVVSLQLAGSNSHWAEYVETNKYSTSAANAKQNTVRNWLTMLKPKDVLDLGANTGHFSRLAAESGARVVSVEVDDACAEIGVRACKDASITTVLPLCIDLTNPSPRLGWAHAERESLADRGGFDVVMALALVHHLAIACNIPLTSFADYLSRLGNSVIIEFVPKEDEQTQRLLAARQDIFPLYTRENFERALRTAFDIVESRPLEDSLRVLYLLRPRNQNANEAHAGLPA
jgi:SAM-dependent methyltransferase